MSPSIPGTTEVWNQLRDVLRTTDTQSSESKGLVEGSNTPPPPQRITSKVDLPPPR